VRERGHKLLETQNIVQEVKLHKQEGREKNKKECGSSKGGGGGRGGVLRKLTGGKKKRSTGPQNQKNQNCRKAGKRSGQDWGKNKKIIHGGNTRNKLTSKDQEWASAVLGFCQLPACPTAFLGRRGGGGPCRKRLISDTRQ